MESEIIGAYIGAGASLAVGVGGIIAAGIANSRAKTANENSKKSNKIAADALAKAAEANKIAKDANALSEEANAISRDNAAKQSDPSHVEWLVEWDAETAIVRVTHTGRDTANNVSVLVKGGEIDQLEKRKEPAARGDKILVPLPQIADDRADHNKEVIARHRSMLNSGWIATLNYFELTLVVDIRWVSDLGNPGFEQFQLTVS